VVRLLIRVRVEKTGVAGAESAKPRCAVTGRGAEPGLRRLSPGHTSVRNPDSIYKTDHLAIPFGDGAD